MNDFYSTKVGDILRLIFPDGTRKGGLKSLEWSDAPPFAADIFAFCAYLIQLNGLMGYFNPNPKGAKRFASTETLRVTLSTTERRACTKASEQWRTSSADNPSPPKLVQDLWDQIYSARNECIRVKKAQKEHREIADGTTEECPAWWTALFKLAIIADEACTGIGHIYKEGGRSKIAEKELNNVPDLRIYDVRLNGNRQRERSNRTDQGLGPDSMIRAEKDVVTLGAFADRHVVCVQPKGRVAQIGCSVRNLSRNLSLTGPVGGVRCNWQQLAQNADEDNLRGSLNILLIPLPWKLHATAFRGQKGDGWGEFDLDQVWLPKEANGAEWETFARAIDDIVNHAKQDTENIEAIVFPELSLNYRVFEGLFTRLSDPKNGALPKLQFMIAGSSNNCDGDTGNHVLTAIKESSLLRTKDGEKETRHVRVFSQRKHHRWKLDKGQIATYGLASALTPSLAWWENHSIESRELNFFQFRKDAIFASLICEDLARNDPCHDIMRSVAPNLVFALLMDGPQLASRWPARYAGSLADDPGSTVITLTCQGLLERSNDQFPERKSISVGLIRDGKGATKEIALPAGHQAVLLTLGTDAVVDQTIDGRSTNNASQWTYISQRPIKV